MPLVKLVSWNVNSIRIRLELLSFLAEKYNPDIICIQEVKAKEAQEKLESEEKEDEHKS